MKKIPEIKLSPKAETKEAKHVLGFEPSDTFWGSCKYGGEPDWIQDPFEPECCGKPMTFYAQIDGLHNDFELADSGIIYVFVCMNCYSAFSEMQSC